MRKLPFYLWVLLMPTTLFAQFKNNIWLMGYIHSSPMPFGGIRIEFNDTSRYIQYEQHNISFDFNYSGLLSKHDNWFIYTNGYAVCNKYHDTLTNGGGLTPGGATNWIYAGLPINNHSILLPASTSGNLVFMLHANFDYIQSDIFVTTLFYSLIYPSAGSFGTVFLKNQVITSDTLVPAPINICKHANGRDWWLLVKKYRSKNFLTYLVSPNGIELKSIQSVTGDTTSSPGGGAFSPNGAYFATNTNETGFKLYNFDRCTGTLSNLKHKDPFWNSGGGVVFSPNSRFLYVNNFDSILQYDLQAPDVLASETLIGISDNFIDSAFIQAMKLTWMHGAEDGKIYITYFSTNRYLAVINNPDNAGTACNFVGHQVLLPTFNLGTTPTPVNLNLFQEPGSPCDTLGVGLQEEKDVGLKLRIAPNPSNGRFYIEYKAQTQSGLLYLYDINGNEVFKEYISPYTTVHEVDVTNKIAPGMYALTLVFGESQSLGREEKTVMIK